MTRKSLVRGTSKARSATRFPPATLVAAEVHIHCRAHDAKSLAAAMGVSTATVGRIVAELRRDLERRGGELVAVKRRGKWRYEIRDDADRERRWDRLERVVGMAEGRPRAVGESVDDVVYGPAGC